MKLGCFHCKRDGYMIQNVVMILVKWLASGEKIMTNYWEYSHWLLALISSSQTELNVSINQDLIWHLVDNVQIMLTLVNQSYWDILESKMGLWATCFITFWAIHQICSLDQCNSNAVKSIIIMDAIWIIHLWLILLNFILSKPLTAFVVLVKSETCKIWKTCEQF